MKILHYSLGFPPYRTGGLTKFCMDLITIQQQKGHEVALLWPGRIHFINKRVSIKETIDKQSGIKSYEIINPNPVALDEGIKNIHNFTEVGDVQFYKKWLSTIKPEVIHIHTLMGLHKAFLQAAKECKVRTVFTTHDYYGLCPKVTLFHDDKTCDDNNRCIDCISCNQTALSIQKIILMQSPIYRKIKNTNIIKKLRSHHRKKFFDSTMKSKLQPDNIREKSFLAIGYLELREYYIDILKMIDMVHFNSTVSEKVYKRYIKNITGKVTSITHRDIEDNRRRKKFDLNQLKITYLAPTKSFKGFNILKQALDEIWEEGSQNFSLKIFSEPNLFSPYMIVRDGYKYEELEKIFDETDLLIAPSVWYETFGYTVLEALSYGVPVIVSENVGAKDIIGDGGCIIECSVEKIKSEIKKILNNRSILLHMNNAIINKINIMTSNEMEEELRNFYYISR